VAENSVKKGPTTSELPEDMVEQLYLLAHYGVLHPKQNALSRLLYQELLPSHFIDSVFGEFVQHMLSWIPHTVLPWPSQYSLY
jgi:hypothetical protein